MKKKNQSVHRQKKRKKGTPIFGNTPYGSKNGIPVTKGFGPPCRKWDTKEEQ